MLQVPEETGKYGLMKGKHKSPDTELKETKIYKLPDK